MKAKHYTLLAGLLLAAGCENPVSEMTTPPAEKKVLTIGESRSWLEDNPPGMLQDYFILWQNAEIQVFEGQQLITVPIYNRAGGLQIAGNATGHDGSGKLEKEKLVFYLDSRGHIAGSLMAVENDETPGHKLIYFFDAHIMKLQSLWKVGGETVSGFPAVDHPGRPDSRTSGCGFADKWVNHCIDKTSRDNICWEYVGTVWTCFPEFGENIPATGGGGGGSGPPIKGPIGGGPSIYPATGFSPYLEGTFSIPLGQTKLQALLASPISEKVLPLVFEAGKHHDIHFSRQEIDYFETFPQQDIEAITNWIKAGKSVVLESLENEIIGLKAKFNNAEKNVLWEYSGENKIRYRLNVLRYGANAYSATSATYAYFHSKQAGDCGECKGNAFKHALFRILDAVSFGREVSGQLGEAHESEEDPSKSMIMDRKNNYAGLQIYDTHKNGGAGIFYWGSKVGDVMANGALVFLIDNQEVPSNTDDPSIPGPL